jgi:hypothetical protein
MLPLWGKSLLDNSTNRGAQNRTRIGSRFGRPNLALSPGDDFPISLLTDLARQNLMSLMGISTSLVIMAKTLVACDAISCRVVGDGRSAAMCFHRGKSPLGSQDAL